MTSHPPLHAEITALLPRLRRFARVLTSSREQADDVVQIAVERAMGRSVQWQAGSRLDSWMLRIVKNVWAEGVPAPSRREHLFAVQAEGDTGADEHAAAHQQRVVLHKAVGLLSDDQRILIGLVLVDGLPYREAAAVLEISAAALTSRLVRAREALQAVLSDPARNLA